MTNNKRSLGSLHIQTKTKPKSPEMTGTIRFQRSTLTALAQQIEGDAIVANLAAWKNVDSRGVYLTVEVSPKFRYAPDNDNFQSDRSIFDMMIDDERG